MGSFETARQEELPGWIDDEVGQAFVGSFGAQQDGELRTLKDGILATMLESAPDDALDVIGSTFRLPRFIRETNDAYRARLEGAWDQYDIGGQAAAIVAILKAMGIVDVVLKEDDAWDAYPGEWFTRFTIVIGPDFGTWLPFAGMTTPFVTGEATSTVTGGATTQGSSAVRAEVLQIKREILKWKGLAALPVQVLVVLDSDVAIGGLFSTPFVTSPEVAYWPIGKFLGIGTFSTPFSTGGFLL